jgi:hypothetical protein
MGVSNKRSLPLVLQDVSLCFQDVSLKRALSPSLLAPLKSTGYYFAFNKLPYVHQIYAAMAITLTDLPDGALETAAGYPSKPARALLLVAISPNKDFMSSAHTHSYKGRLVVA